MPDLAAEPIPSMPTLQWFGRAWARVSATGDDDGAKQLKAILEILQSGFRQPNDQGTLAAILYRALGVAELNAPASAKGSFIPAGNSFDAMIGVGKVLGSATKAALIVDPYMDVKTLDDFVVLAPDGVPIQLLADPAFCKPSLKPAVERWIAQYGSSRPVEARLTASRALHDRLIVVDGAAVWVLTQSLKDLGARSPEPSPALIRIRPRSRYQPTKPCGRQRRRFEPNVLAWFHRARYHLPMLKARRRIRAQHDFLFSLGT